MNENKSQNDLANPYLKFVSIIHPHHNLSLQNNDEIFSLNNSWIFCTFYHQVVDEIPNTNHNA